MIIIGILGMFAADALQTTTPSAAVLGISATVVRPVEISQPSVASDGDLLVIRNAGSIAVEVDGGGVSWSANDETWLVSSKDENAVVTVTLTF